MAFDFEPSIILETAPQLLSGVKLTLILTVGGLLFGLLLGVITGLANTSRSRFLRGIAIVYIEAIRGTPLIVQVMFLSLIHISEPTRQILLSRMPSSA